MAEKVFDLPVHLNLNTVADVTSEAAAKAAHRYGFDKSVTDWRDIISNPQIDIVSVTAPNALHKEMALAAIAAGKHVYCEKPLAPRVDDAREMAEAAAQAGVKTQVGFNYICNPIITLARDMIATGELGDIRSYRGIHAEDYMADANAPWTFRHDPEGGGALADLGSHALATAEFLLGPISRVLGDRVTVIGERPASSVPRAVEVDDIGRAFLRFACGVSGSIEASWVASGRKMQHAFEVYGSKGCIMCDLERMNELHFFDAKAPANRSGFRCILAAPEHPPYGKFCVAPGHQLGFNDLKAIEVAGFARAIAYNEKEPFNFFKGLRIQTLVEAVQVSAQSGQWEETVSNCPL